MKTVLGPVGRVKRTSADSCLRKRMEGVAVIVSMHFWDSSRASSPCFGRELGSSVMSWFPGSGQSGSPVQSTSASLQVYKWGSKG